MTFEPVDQLRGVLAARKARRYLDEHEARDICELHHDPARLEQLIGEHDAYSEDRDFNKARLTENPTEDAVQALMGTVLPGNGRVLKHVKGMGTVYDWRHSPWTPSNGGRINPLIFVQHIPVVPNMAGIADFIRLRDVLVAQGLMVQNATDRDGNVALYTPMNSLCYQARGANQFSCGTEHMHLTVNEEWTKRQLRASAWLVNQALDKHGIPTYEAKLASGSGVARVSRRGQASHKAVSAAAGYHDRSDPGSGYDDEYVRHCVLKYRERIRNGTADNEGFEGL